MAAPCFHAFAKCSSWFIFIICTILEPLCCKKWHKKVLVKTQDTCFGNRGPLKALNDNKLILKGGHSCLFRTNLVSFRISDVPYSLNQLLHKDFFCHFLQQSSSNFLIQMLLGSGMFIVNFKIWPAIRLLYLCLKMRRKYDSIYPCHFLALFGWWLSRQTFSKSKREIVILIIQSNLSTDFVGCLRKDFVYWIH